MVKVKRAVFGFDYLLRCFSVDQGVGSTASSRIEIVIDSIATVECTFFLGKDPCIFFSFFTLKN